MASGAGRGGTTGVGPPNPGAAFFHLPAGDNFSSHLAAQVRCHGGGSYMKFIRSRGWSSHRNQRESETLAFILDEMRVDKGWPYILDGPLHVEAASRRLAVLFEVDDGRHT